MTELTKAIPTAQLITPPLAVPLSQDHSHPVHDLRRWRHWLLLALALVLVRLLLPFTATDAAFTHARILDSLLAGQTWGRQALVGSFEFPPLPTLALILAQSLARLVPTITGAELLTAVAQVWALAYLARCGRGLARRLGIAALLLGLIIMLPNARALALRADPNWISLVPLLSMLYHLNSWYRNAALRDIIVIAINAGLLCFAGPVAAAAATAIVLLLSWQLHRNQLLQNSDKQGLALLLWMPLVYGMLLVLLFNWLIMGNALFLLLKSSRVCHALDTALLLPELRRYAAGLLPLTALLLPLLVLLLGQARQRRVVAALLLALGCSLPLSLVLGAANLTVPAGNLVVVGLLVAAPVLAMAHSNRRQTLSALLLSGVALAVAVGWAPVHPAPITALRAAAPEPAEILNWIDQSWPDARVKVYGICAPAYFPDLAETRFQARLDFHEQLFLEQAGQEQLYLLVPPAEARFYACDNRGLHNIRRQGRPWLLLERQWHSGWQLWRCVLTPKG